MGSSSYNLFQSMEPQLPPGFRFHPTDEELISYYLLKKVTDSNFTCKAIAEVDLNKCEPWQLPEKAKMGEKEWYFYSLRDRKYPTGLRTNRATECGYWKATGKDREIHTSKTHTLVGMKKTLVFYRGRAPKGEKTNWVMHEYRLDGKFSCLYISRSAKDEWVISRLFRKNNSGSTTVHGGGKQMMLTHGINICSEVSSSSSVSLSLPPLFDSSPYAATATSASTTTDLEISSSYDVNHHSIKEHVPCFSNIIPTTTGPPPAAGFNHYSSLHQFNLPPPADQAPVSGSPLDPYAVFGFQPFSRSSAVTTFPSLGSLHENLHLSSFNMAAANAGNGVNENDGGAGPYGSIGNWAAPVSLNKGGGGHSELDCMWRF